MARIRYTEYSFIPKVLSFQDYTELKKVLETCPERFEEATTVSSYSPGKSLQESFSKKMIIFGSVVVSSFLLSKVFGKSFGTLHDIFEMGYVLPVFIGVFALPSLSLTASSANKYDERKREYFNHVREAVKNAGTYEDFNEKHKKYLRNYEILTGISVL